MKLKSDRRKQKYPKYIQASYIKVIKLDFCTQLKRIEVKPNSLTNVNINLE